jgi:hypothetical protein
VVEAPEKLKLNVICDEGCDEGCAGAGASCREVEAFDGTSATGCFAGALGTDRTGAGLVAFTGSTIACV